MPETADATPADRLTLEPVDCLRATGLARIQALADPQFVAATEAMRRVDMGTHPTLLRDGLGHWSRVWEYPFSYLGVLDFVQEMGLTNPTSLESGCGFTPVPFLLAARGVRVAGVDLDPALPEQWKNYSLPGSGTGGEATFHNGDMEKLPFPDGSFDIGYSVSALEHTTDPERATAELCRVVRPGGLVLLTCDVEPRGIGIPYAKFEAMLKVLDAATTLRYPPRWCHPSEVLTFGTRPGGPEDAARGSYQRARGLVRDAYYAASGKTATVMAIFGTARIKT